MSFTATYPGTCAACDTRFPAGTEIEFDGSNEVVHAGKCPSDIDVQREVCGYCFLEVPVVRTCPCRE